MDAQTRMLMYYLNAMGQGLAGKDHPMQQVGAVTEQQIKAESQMKLIQKLLDSGGTVKRGKTGGIDVSGDVSYFISDIADEESIDKKNPFSGTMSELSKDEQKLNGAEILKPFLQPSRY
jgi:predicted regulator of amino acid metabolism with ACT domain